MDEAEVKVISMHHTEVCKYCSRMIYQELTTDRWFHVFSGDFLRSNYYDGCHDATPDTE